MRSDCPRTTQEKQPGTFAGKGLRGIPASLLAVLLIAALPLTAAAERGIELTPVAGYRFGSGIDITTGGADTSSRLRFKDSESLGFILNVDLGEAGKQAELYFARQDTTAYSSDVILEPDTRAIDLVIYQLQFGGLYFPGGRNTGGFVSGVAGVTRLDPKDSNLRTHHRASLSLGGGYKFRLTENLLLRLDLRGIYTALDSGGSVFCSGGCRARYDSSGYFQAEAGAGLVIRF